MNEHIVKAAITLAIQRFARLAYNHDGEDALPIRPDVKVWAQDLMGSDFYGVRSYGTLEEPALSLEKDGTVKIHFLQGHAALVLHFPSAYVVKIERHFPDEKTVIHDTLNLHKQGSSLHTIDRALDWICSQAETTSKEHAS